MGISEIIELNTVKTHMQATSKEQAIKELSELLLANGFIDNIERFIEDIYAREAIGQTGIGNFIAIPHGKSSSVKKNGVAIGINDYEIPWESLDGKGVKGIILFAVGQNKNDDQNHLKMLSVFAKKLGNDEVIKNLLESEKAEDVIKVFGY